MLIKLDLEGNQIACEFEPFHEYFAMDDTEIHLPGNIIDSKAFVYCPYCGIKLNNDVNGTGSPNINRP